MSTSKNDFSAPVHAIVTSLPRHGYPFSRRDIPANGVYFFFERGEDVPIGDQVVGRIVRVGTHTGEGRLGRRLGIHFAENRRRSVFRLHLGAALLRRGTPDDPRLTTWISAKLTPIPDVEDAVSGLLRERFTFSCIQVDDTTERLEFERSLIGLLARHPLGPPSTDWLGRHAFRPEIRRSGLWNTQHFDAEPLDATGFKRLEELATRTPE